MNEVMGKMPKSKGWPIADRFHFGRSKGLLVAISVFIIALGTTAVLSPRGYSYYDFSNLCGSGAALALAAVGETLVIIIGGFDLTAGSVVAVVNVILATQFGNTLFSQISWCFIAILLGAGIGAINGFFICYLRLQSIVVTLAMMFILNGVALLILKQPGASIPPTFSQWITGDAIPGILPMPAMIVLIGLLAWRIICSCRLGTGAFAVGSDENGAMANGVRVRLVKFRVYVIAGIYYAVGGIFITGLTGSGDPLIGVPMLLPIFAAVVLGGTQFEGGKGGATGSVFGAYILMLIVSLLITLNVSAYYATAVEGCLLILAAIGPMLSRNSELGKSMRVAQLGIIAWLDRSHSKRIVAGQSIRILNRNFETGEIKENLNSLTRGWVRRNAQQLRLIIPPFLVFCLLVIISRFFSGSSTSFFFYTNSLLLLTTFLAIVGFGQGAVILTGGLDLSVPWLIAWCGILLTSLASGSNSAAIWAVPLVLLTGVSIGFINGIAVGVVGLSPIIVTLAMNGILEAVALVYTGGTPQGFSPPCISWFMSGKLWGVRPAIYGLLIFVIGGTLLLTKTSFGRFVYAVGNSRQVSTLSGVPVRFVVVLVYGLSGLCAAIVGILLTGFNTQAFNGMGDPYLLSSIAVVVVGGTLITGGKGHYLGIFGAALLLTALQILLTGSQVGLPVRDIIYGVVLMLAIFAHRENKMSN